MAKHKSTPRLKFRKISKKFACKVLCFSLIFFSNIVFSQTFNWGKSLEGNQEGKCWATTVDKFGNLYSTGFFSGTVDMDPGVGIFTYLANGFRDLYLNKLDSAGNFVLAKHILGNNNVQGLSIRVDKSDNIIIGGMYEGTTDFDPGSGSFYLYNSGFFILKLNQYGDFLWAKSFENSGYPWNYPMTIGIDTNNNIYSTGTFSNTVDFDPGNSVYPLTSLGYYSTFISKLDSNGNFVWAEMIGYKDSKCLTISPDGYVYISSSGSFLNVDFDPGPSVYPLSYFNVLLKLNQAGDFVWAKGIAGLSLSNAIIVNNYGEIIQTGRFRTTVDVDPSNNVYNLNSCVFNDDDIFIVKWDSLGNFLWAKSCGNIGWDESHSLDIDSSGNIVIGGIYHGITDFDFGSDTLLISPISSPDCFILKIDSDANLLWIKSIDGGYSFTYDKSILVKEFNNHSIYYSGFFSNIVDFDPNSGIYNMTCTGSTNIYSAKLNECTIYDTTTLSGCNYIIFDSIYYFNTGYYLKHVIGNNGCDSIHILDILISHIRDSISETICQGNSYSGYTSTGIYTDTLISSNGCDSIRILNLTVLPYCSSYLTQTICQGDSYSGYSSSGIYIDTLISSNGCDSIRTLNLSILPNSSSNLSQTICQGDTFLGYASTGIYIDTLISINGCDSVRILNLTTLPYSTSNLTQTICEGNTFLGYSSTGIYTDTLISSNGCDSIRILNLTVLPYGSSYLTQTICQGDSYSGYSASGIYIDTLISSIGCDSIRIVDLTVVPNLHDTIFYILCPGETIFSYYKPGLYIDTFINSAGCDSIRILKLEVDKNLCCQIFTPNAFSPNGDNKNDEFNIKGIFDEYNILIVDRWGNLVFQSSNSYLGWDGKYKGIEMPIGTYYYVLKYRCNHSMLKIVKGDITLIR